jgi:hypothetical protein
MSIEQSEINDEIREDDDAKIAENINLQIHNIGYPCTDLFWRARNCLK